MTGSQQECENAGKNGNCAEDPGKGPFREGPNWPPEKTGPMTQTRKSLKRHGGQFALFSMVGVFSTIVDFAVFAAAIFFGMAPVFANLLAFGIANPNSYFFNSRITFRQGAEAAPLSFRRYGKFLVAHLFSLILSTGMVAIFSDQIGPLWAKIAAIVLTLFLNYAASAFLVYPQAKSTAGDPGE